MRMRHNRDDIATLKILYSKQSEGVLAELNVAVYTYSIYYPIYA